MRRSGTPMVVVWASTKPPGGGALRGRPGATGWVLEGSLVRRFKPGPAFISYRIETDLGWKTRRVRAEQVLRGEHRTLELQAKGGKWYLDGKAEGGLAGCVGVDLGASPATNTLPIKRARPRVGRGRSWRQPG